MRKLIFCFIFSLFGCFTFSQNHNLEVLYSIKMKKLEGEKLSKSASKLSLAFEKRKFKLQIKDKESLFSSHETLTNKETTDDMLAKIALGSDNEYYANSSENIIVKKVSALGTFFVIECDFENNWNITKEKKKIDNYNCYKATKSIIKENFKGEKFEINVEAWYCPELSMSFGPLEYNGLPGLILELHLDNIIYYANSIKIFKTKEISIERPKGNNKISQSDFDKLIKEAINNREN